MKFFLISFGSECKTRCSISLSSLISLEKMSTRQKPEFVANLFAIYNELPKPLQFARERFEETIKDPNTILD